MPFIGFDQNHEIVTVPQENVSPHLRGTRRNARGIPQTSTRVARQIEFRHAVITHIRQGRHQRKRRHMRKMTDGAKNFVVEKRIHLQHDRPCKLPEGTNRAQGVRVRLDRWSQDAAGARKEHLRSCSDSGLFLSGNWMCAHEPHRGRHQRFRPRDQITLHAPDVAYDGPRLEISRPFLQMPFIRVHRRGPTGRSPPPQRLLVGPIRIDRWRPFRLPS